MKCTNCGAELQEGTLFCSECGTKVILPESQTFAANNFAQSGVQDNFQNNFGQPAGGQGASFDNIYAGVPDPAATPAGGGKKKGGIKKILIPIIVLLIVAAAAIGGVLFYLNSRPIEVELKDYVKVSFEGYDTLGTATVEFDSKKFKSDYEDKIKYHGKDKDMKDKSAKKLIAEYLESVSLDKTEKLSNGDKVTVKFKHDADELLEDLNIKTTTDGITFDVKGLEAVPTFDPFEGLEITYNGTAPDAYASLDYSNVTNEYYNDYAYSFNYDYDTLQDLDNGDVITITIKYDDTQSDEEYIANFIQTYGAMPTAVSKDFTVEGLPVAITKADQIDDNILGQIQDYIEDQELVFTSDDIGTGLTDDGEVTLGNVEYYGMYVGEPKEDSYYDFRAYVTYKITLAYGKEEYSYYYVVEIDGLVLDGDGNLMTDKINYSTYNYDYLSHNFKDGYRVYGMYGYEATSDLEDDVSYYSSYFNFKWVLAGETKSGSSSSSGSDDSTTGTSEEGTEEDTTEETTEEEATEEEETEESEESEEESKEDE